MNRKEDCTSKKKAKKEEPKNNVNEETEGSKIVAVTTEFSNRSIRVTKGAKRGRHA